MSGVPILMYHSIGGSDRLSVPGATFAAHMAALWQQGYTSLPLTALTRWLGTGEHGAGPRRLPRRSVVITFDDGYADVHERALPILARYGFPATVFVTSGWLRDAGRYAAGRPPGRMLAWKQVAELADEGVEIGGHGHSHAQLDQLPDARLRDELFRNRGLLEDRLGREVTTMAYPYGYCSGRVRDRARAAGYHCAFAVANRTVAENADRFALPRLTMRAGTSGAAFTAALSGRGFRLDHFLTKGYAVVRRSRYAARRLRGRA